MDSWGLINNIAYGIERTFEASDAAGRFCLLLTNSFGASLPPRRSPSSSRRPSYERLEVPVVVPSSPTTPSAVFVLLSSAGFSTPLGYLHLLLPYGKLDCLRLFTAPSPSYLRTPLESKRHWNVSVK